jgi:hypothetical protein
MAQNWRQYLEDTFEDEHTKVERIPQKPKRDNDKLPPKKKKSVSENQ